MIVFLLIFFKTAESYLDLLTTTTINNAANCLSTNKNDRTAICDNDINYFLEAASSALREIITQTETILYSSSPLIIFPGVQSGVLRLSASSALYSEASANRARINTTVREGRSCWSPLTLNQYEWLQFSSFFPVRFHIVQTLGSSRDSLYLKSFLIHYTQDGINWQAYQNGYVFTANNDYTTAVNNTFSPSFIARAVRIYPLTWYSSTTYCFRAELFISKIYYDSEALPRVVLRPAILTGLGVSASSVYLPDNQEKFLINSRSFTGNTAWCAGVTSFPQYVTISAPSPVWWYRIATQGRGDDSDSSRVNSIRIIYTKDGIQWSNYSYATNFWIGSDKFTTYSLDLKPFLALAIRVFAVANSSSACFRIEAYVKMV